MSLPVDSRLVLQMLTSDLPCSVFFCKSGIDSIAQIPESSLESYNQVTQNAFAEGMTWERIIVLLFVFGELAVRVGPKPLILVLVNFVGTRFESQSKLA